MFLSQFICFLLGVTALVHALLDAAVCLLVGAAATASLHHIEDVRNCHMLTGRVTLFELDNFLDDEYDELPVPYPLRNSLKHALESVTF